MTIKKKLTLVSAAVIMVLTAIVGFLTISLSSIQNKVEAFADQTSQMKTSVSSLSQSSAVHQAELSKTEQALIEANDKLFEAQQRLRILEKKTTGLNGDIDVLIEELDSSARQAFSSQERDALNTASLMIAEIQTAMQRDTLINLQAALSSMNQSVTVLEEKTSALSDMKMAMEVSFEQLYQLNQATGVMNDAAAESVDDIGNKVAFILGINVIGIVLIFMCKAALRNLVLTPLKDTQNTLIAAEENSDLTTRLNVGHQDEYNDISKSFNLFLDKIAMILGSVDNSTLQLSTSARETHDLASESKRVIEQSSEDIESIVAAVSEMSSAAQNVAHNAEESAHKTQSVDQEVIAGKRIIGIAIQEVFQLAEHIKSSEVLMDKLQEKSNNIGQVVEVIRDVSEQTNLLSLNAAIEAARAGEMGRGFAVVADEVRALANRSAESTQEIQDIVEEIQHFCDKTAAMMHSCCNNSDKAVSEAQSAEKALTRINDSVDEISEMIVSIASAAEEQATVCNSIERSVLDLNDLAQQSVDCSQQSTTVAASLNDLSQDLKLKLAQVKFS